MNLIKGRLWKFWLSNNFRVKFTRSRAPAASPDQSWYASDTTALPTGLYQFQSYLDFHKMWDVPGFCSFCSKCTKVRIEDTPNKESWLGKHTPNLWSHHSLPLRVDSMYIPGTFTGQNFHETMIHCITEHFRELNLRGKLNPTFTKWSKLTTVCTREAYNRDLRHILQHCLYVGIFISAIQTRITA